MDVILEDYVDSEGEVPSMMAPMLEMVFPIPSAIRQQMEIGVHDIMLQMSKKLGDIVKPLVLNRIQKAWEEEHHHTASQRRRLIMFPEVSLWMLGQWQTWMNLDLLQCNLVPSKLLGIHYHFRRYWIVAITLNDSRNNKSTNTSVCGSRPDMGIC